MSVRPSVTRRYSVETAKRIIALFYRLKATVLVFLHQTVWQYADVDLPNLGVECRGV